MSENASSQFQPPPFKDPQTAQAQQEAQVTQAAQAAHAVHAQHADEAELDIPEHLQRLRIYSHSSLVYWWPVWLVGCVMALITYWQGYGYQLGQSQTWVHPSNNLGLIFFLVFFLVLVITNFSVRGMASGMVIMGVTLVTVVLALLGWWDEIFRWFGRLQIQLNLGAYFWFSTVMFTLWAVTVFVLDRMSYWEITPGQLTHFSFLGGGSRSYNAQGMGLEKHRDDLFRHWLLGLGSGDLQIRTSGATHEKIDVLNVLFISKKMKRIQKLIAEVPEGSENE